MRYLKFISISLLIILCCTSQKQLVTPGYDFTKIKTITVQEIKDYPNANGSGEIVFSALSDHLMDMHIDIVEEQHSSDITLLCSISDFNDQRTVFIPVEIVDKGGTLSGIGKAYAETDAMENTTRNIGEKKDTHIKETVTRTKEIKYTDVAVGLKLQLLDVNKGAVVWSSDYTYSALNQKDALKKCVTGALKPLIKTLKK